MTARRRVQYVLVCEDQQHEAFGRRLLEERTDEDDVAVFIPTWNIETWLAYLDGEDVDEERGNYPRLRRPRDCAEHVRRLAELCRRRALRQPAPWSLVTACREYDGRLR